MKLKDWRQFFNGRRITVISLALFVVILLIVYISSSYAEECTEREAASQQKRIEMTALGRDLADASDYLTEEARVFAGTGDIAHLYNYWHEVNVDKNRDAVIEGLSAYSPPAEEAALLREAKKYSDALINTETASMRLMLEYAGVKAGDFSDPEVFSYVEYVLSKPLPENCQGLSSDEKRVRAMEMLYDGSYTTYKAMIMSPIEKFQQVMNTRLDNEVRQTQESREKAQVIHNCCMVLVLALVALLMVGINLLYIEPLKQYYKKLTAGGKVSADGHMSEDYFTKIRVTPTGASELYEFGDSYNRLSAVLQKELSLRINAEEEMRIAKDRADNLNHAKSEFLARMSHELRTPLNAIIGYLYILRKTELDENQERCCRNISLSVENLLGLINNVLDFSKIESGKMTVDITDFNLEHLIRDVYAIMENSAAEKGLNFHLETKGEIPVYVRGDVVKLRQVLINLIGNSVKFTTTGEVRLSVESMGGYSVRFAVRDTGIGVKDEDKQAIFEPFRQADAGIARKYGGTGLGLPISKLIVETVSGGGHTIELNSEEGKGSEFAFVMDFFKGNPPRETHKEIRMSFGDRKKVLLVDDNKMNLEIEKELLTGCGLRVDTASSGNEAIAMAADNHYDIILLDLHMPDMDGCETARKIRRLDGCRLTPIAALTADVMTDTLDNALKSGMNAYLTKPFEPDKLSELIFRFLNISVENPEAFITETGRKFARLTCQERMSGNKNALLRLVRHFLSENENTPRYVRAHIDSGNYGNAASILHDIKGLTGNLCCDELSAIAGELCDECRRGESGSLDEFTRIWDETIAEMREFSDNTEEDEGEQLQFSELLDIFLTHCRSFDITAAEVFDDHRREFTENLDKDTFRKLEDRIRRYDFEEILQLFDKED